LTNLFSNEEYAVDTSGLIHGWNKYPPKIFESLWKNIEEMINDGKIIAPEEVKNELGVGGDDLFDWCKNFPDFFLKIEADVQMSVTNLLKNPEHRKLLNLKTPSIYCADVWVIATAQTKNLIVIHEENLLTSPSPYKNKIPNVCNDLKISHLSFLEFVEVQNWKF